MKPVSISWRCVPSLFYVIFGKILHKLMNFDSLWFILKILSECGIVNNLALPEQRSLRETGIPEAAISCIGCVSLTLPLKG